MKIQGYRNYDVGGYFQGVSISKKDSYSDELYIIIPDDYKVYKNSYDDFIVEAPWGDRSIIPTDMGNEYSGRTAVPVLYFSKNGKPYTLRLKVEDR